MGVRRWFCGCWIETERIAEEEMMQGDHGVGREEFIECLTELFPLSGGLVHKEGWVKLTR